MVAEPVTEVISVMGDVQAIIRPAVVADAAAIADLINTYASRGEMLPKSRYQVYQHIRSFVVAEIDGTIASCAVLHVMWEDLAEVRSLAVRQPYRGQGLGRAMVKRLIEMAKSLGLPQVFALTYTPEFFEALGFTRIDKRSLPQKIWIDCIDCVKFPECDEEALLLSLE
jgi:amino-acid N-acetyltransferase